eukprot:3777993-Prorocentrum_lima.AAC.1
MGQRLAGNKFLFIDPDRLVKRQRTQGTLGAPQTALLSDLETMINRLKKDVQNHLLQGPFKD